MRFLLLPLFWFICGVANAQSPGQAIESVLELNRSALAAQQRIDRLYKERQEILSDITTIKQEGTIYAIRNRELEQELSEIRQNLFDIDADLRAVTETQTGIITLLDAMINSLARFIELDLPFELEKRNAVIGALRSELVRPDIDVTKKYQAVVSAYLNEIRSGYSDAVSQETIETPRGSRLANILRLGRAGLWYVTPDGAEAGYWDPVRRSWSDAETRPQTVLMGIRAVRASGVPATLELPIHLNLPQ